MIKTLKIVFTFLLCPSLLFIGNYCRADVSFPTLPPSVEQKIIAQAPNLKPQVLNLALLAYDHARQMGLDQQAMLTVVDYSLPSNEKRMWVINLQNDQVVENLLVAHGKGSGEKYATNFSNNPATHASSIGVYETGDTYFGEHGDSLRLIGLDKGFNDNAEKREIVLHGAWYVNPQMAAIRGQIGRSWGCLAVNENIYQQVINLIKNGTVIVAYYPDQNWLSHSPFLKPLSSSIV